MALEKFKKKVVVCSYEEAVSVNKSVYCKLIIVADDGTQYIAYYFGYSAKSDKQYFDNPNNVYEITGTVSNDNSIKVTNIDLTNDVAADIIKPTINVDQEKSIFIESLKIFVKDKYKALIKTMLMDKFDSIANASLSDFPYTPHSLIQHINQCLKLLQHITTLYHDVVLDTEAMAAAIMFYAIDRSDTANDSCFRFDPSAFAKVAGSSESTMAAVYKMIHDSKNCASDFTCMIDIISALVNERFSNTLEGRITFHIVKMDRVIQTVQTKFKSSKQDGIINMNGQVDRNHVIYYPAGFLQS
jgi:hypothetical protein